jgi:hypothetical protein
MKKVIFAFALLLSFYGPFGATAKETPVVVLSTSHDIFYFKICKTMVGGMVEVYNPEGKVVGTQNLDSRKLIIDFFDMAPGDYTIKVKKENTEETFTYHRDGFQMVVKEGATDASKLPADLSK